MAGEVVGQNGLEAIRDFIKPFEISASDISNASSIASIGSSDTTIKYLGHTSISYTLYISNTVLNTALKYNFLKITQYTNATPIIVAHSKPYVYEGGCDGYYYYIHIDNGLGECAVVVHSLSLRTGSMYINGISIPTGDLVYDLTSLFSFSNSELTSLFGKLLAQNSFILTKTSSITGDPTNDMDQGYLVLPLNTTGTATGVVNMKFMGGDKTSSTVTSYGRGESGFFGTHQIGQITQAGSTRTLILTNTTDLAIQVISASDYANLTSKDSNVLYFIPAE